MTQVKRQVLAVRLSRAGEKKGQTIAICGDCLNDLPAGASGVKSGAAGEWIRCCEWCGVANGQPDENAEIRVRAGSSIISKIGLGDAEHFTCIGDALSKSILRTGEMINNKEENLPVSAVMLEIEFSPVIPLPFGGLETAVEVEELTGDLYRFEFNHEIYTVNSEQLKEMRARYLVTNAAAQKKYLRENNPPGSIWHAIGSL